jgi:type I restriction enzyme M protein
MFLIEYPQLEMSPSTPLDDSSVLFSHLPADGTSIGNGALRDLLGWDGDRYFAARQLLIDAGRVVTGKGRGGAVKRADGAGKVTYPSAAKARAARKRVDALQELPLALLDPAPPAETPARERKTTTKAAAPEKTLEAQLWDAANKMRGAVPPTDYMHVCLGLVFLRYLSAAFSRKEAELKETPYAVMDDPEEYQADNVFWVPLEARWGTLQGFPAPRMSASASTTPCGPSSARMTNSRACCQKSSARRTSAPKCSAG